jgi:hypothetical protein
MAVGCSSSNRTSKRLQQLPAGKWELDSSAAEKVSELRIDDV